MVDYKDTSIRNRHQVGRYVETVHYSLEFDPPWWSQTPGLGDEVRDPIPVAGSNLLSETQFQDFAQASMALTETAVRLQKLKGLAEKTWGYTSFRPCSNL